MSYNIDNFNKMTEEELLEITGGCGCEADGTSCHCGNTYVQTTVGKRID